MCAIFGIIGKNNDYLLKKISESQIYRGPDEQNFFIDKETLFEKINEWTIKYFSRTLVSCSTTISSPPVILYLLWMINNFFNLMNPFE